MEVNKLSFLELQNSNKVTDSFDKLDVNGDGVINNNDKSLAKTSSIKNQIDNVLNSTDEEYCLDGNCSDSLDEINNALNSKTSKSTTTQRTPEKDAYGINETDTDNFENDVYNSTGTVYVVMGQTKGCSYCKKLAEAMVQRMDELENVAQVYDMTWNNKNTKLCWEIYRQGVGKNAFHVDFPQIAKFVDGKFVELVDKPRNPEIAVLNMIDKAEGVPKKNQDKSASANKTSGIEGITNNNNSEKISSLEAQITKYQSLSELLEEMVQDAQKNIDKILEEKEEKELELKIAQDELEEKQEEYDNLTAELNNADEENAPILQAKLESLGADLSSLRLKAENLSTEINSIQNKYTAAQMNYNIQVNSAKSNKDKLDKLISNLNEVKSNSNQPTTLNANSTTNTSDDNIDWNALTVEGKGVNINNLFNILDTATGDCKNQDHNNAISAKEIEAIHQNGTDEQKAIIDKLFFFNEKNGKLTRESSNMAKVLFTTMGKVGGLASLAYYDKDGDGFLSDEEFNNMRSTATNEADRIYRLQIINAGRAAAKNIIMNGYKISENDKVKCQSFGDFTVTQSTINGKKVYFANNFERSQLLTVTEDEMCILDQFLNEENRSKYQKNGVADLSDIWNGLGATTLQYNESLEIEGQNYSFTNSSDGRSSHVFVNSAGVVCSYLHNEHCSQCDESFYNLYAGIKSMMNNEEMQFYEAGKRFKKSTIYMKDKQV